MIPAFINPRAGKGEAARGALESVGDFDILDVPPATLVAQVKSAIAGGARRILVAGGDGSIASAASAVAGTGIELAILPCGTLNHLARGLSLPLDLEEAARLAKTGHSMPVDSAEVNNQIFLNTSSVGSYVTFVRARERLERRLGYHIGSIVAGIRLLVHMPTFRVTVDVERRTRAYITPLVFIGVGERELRLPTLGARVAGGKAGLHVMVVRRRSGGRAVALGLAAAARGVEAVSHTPALDAFLVDSCRIEPHSHNVSIDGEIVQIPPPLRYRYMPGHLRVVVP